MSFAAEKRHAHHLLSLLEDGRHPLVDHRHHFEEADPVLIHALFSWLRARYPASHSTSQGVLGRVVELCAMSSKVARAARDAHQDPLVEWFEETYTYKDLDRDELIDILVDKLEG